MTIFSYSSPEIYRAAARYTATVSAGLSCSGKYVCKGPGECDKEDCFRLISVDMVYDAVKKLLEKMSKT